MKLLGYTNKIITFVAHNEGKGSAPTNPSINV